MSSVTRMLLFDINPEETSQYILTTLKYRNIASSIASVMMLPAPEFAFTDGSPNAKGRRCACVTVCCWSDSESAYELVSELKKNGTSSIPHIGGTWTVKLLQEPTTTLLMDIAGDNDWALDYEPDDYNSIDTDIEDEFEPDMKFEPEINNYRDNIYHCVDKDHNYESDSEIAKIFPEETCWKTISADGETLINVHWPINIQDQDEGEDQDEGQDQDEDRDDKLFNSLIKKTWLYDAPSPIPEAPKLVRWNDNCIKKNCDLCVPLENNDCNNLYVQ